MMKNSCQRSRKMLRVRFKCEVQIIEYDSYRELVNPEEEFHGKQEFPAVERSRHGKGKENETSFKKLLFIIVFLLAVLFKWWTAIK